MIESGISDIAATSTRYHLCYWHGSSLHLMLHFHYLLVSMQTLLAVLLFLLRSLEIRWTAYFKLALTHFRKLEN